ncbi:enhancer of mRNA-decapping protein 3-like [Tropilaelaps mercedesae]|uniref:Enhancer of mRNA-decapping protein 3-like n=1 Tax=Tropilaelaps mercedesae TaxID=418985 RepID=A0A1V9XJH0_9ACAR|nr:enhancer of mRNA-decapping protein 3-like [Tropilaelaps mercedesae]
MSARCVQYEGALVEIDCSVLGVYRGVIEKIDERDQSVAIRNPSKDGKRLVHSEVVIAAADIANIRFVNKLSGSPVLKERNSPNCGGRSPLKTPRLDKEGQRVQRQRTTSNSLSTLRARRDKECFGEASDDASLQEDFDFEKNLELFNKEEVFAEIDRAHAGESVIRLADCNIRKEKKYRHDENVIANADKVVGRDDQKRQNTVLFSVDGSGSKVPAVARSTRDAILTEATRRGLSNDCLREATARNICSLILQQNNRNTVVFVVSPEKVSGPLNISLCGITAARQLAGGKVPNLYVMTTRSVTAEDAAFRTELELAELAGVHVIDASRPPNASVDIVVGCSLHPYLDQCGKRASTTVLLIDPPFYSPNLANIVLFPLLPLHSSVPIENDSKCKMYIGDLAVPAKLYKSKAELDAEGLYPQDGFVARIKRA